MKNGLIKSVIAAMLLCVMLFMLTACAATLKGTYTNRDGLIEQSFIFEDGNKVKISAFGLVAIEGDYEIKGNKLIVTYSLLSLSYNQEYTFEQNGNSVTINGTVFTKE